MYLEIGVGIVTIIFCTSIYSSIASKFDIPRAQSLDREQTQMYSIQIPSAGGYSKLRLQPMNGPTKGANIKQAKPGDPGMLVVQTKAFGVNYADICIRWGLYSSAKKYVGWPITPGFEFSGTVVQAPQKSKFEVGTQVFGVSLFGGYSSHVLVPENQVWRQPSNMSLEESAGFPAVAMTAYYALFELLNIKPKHGKMPKVLVHSAAGGVGSMLIQMLAIINCDVCGVVGSTHKIELVQNLGCSNVIDKSKQNLWKAVSQWAPEGVDIILDANGVATLNQSWKHLCPEGKLVVYGFHTMLPQTGGISPLRWLKMGLDLARTPRFNPLEMTNENKSVLSFNLSFLFDRTDMLDEAMNRLMEWVESGRLKVAKVNVFDITKIQEAQQYIQSGQSTGKIVIST